MGIERVSASEAEALLGGLPLPLLPATLQPGYIEAEARRVPDVETAYLVFRDGGATWLHAPHLGRVPGTEWRDASSPYGYGGPLSSSDDGEFLRAAWQAYAEWMRGHGVVVEYIRFHPVLRNERHYGGHVEDNREVVMVDLSTDFPAGYAPRVRQVLKKADRAPIAYREVPLADAVPRFGAFYRAAMIALQADPSFLFEDSYFRHLAAIPGARLALCTAAGQPDDWLAAALVLDGRGVREYHLAGSTAAGRQCGAATFVLHQAALSARASGLQCLYLGGGSDRRPDNSLLYFKGGFGAGRWLYRTGWWVFDEERYSQVKKLFPAELAAHPDRPIFHRRV
ncbi:GNAT family N-acetyltransferase [Ramlibacter humi]|uniref:GNAT family N-acetyltransferase n=1 Tax=Ramlibacter humi TaxID=2530451 RepID=A0A4Z0BYM1_9BURK|nr:GNAT family N-acetyltransferase [Ramlibacter humi]TFZ04071.1 GNAT family N-acetyltransferase [Ramlibacter humi]